MIIFNKFKEFIIGVSSGIGGILLFLFLNRSRKTSASMNKDNVSSKVAEKLIENVYKEDDKKIKEAEEDVRKTTTREGDSMSTSTPAQSFYNGTEAMDYLNNILNSDKHSNK